MARPPRVITADQSDQTRSPWDIWRERFTQDLGPKLERVLREALNVPHASRAQLLKRLEERTGVPANTAKKWLSGEKGAAPGAAPLARIAQVLGLSADVLLGMEASRQTADFQVQFRNYLRWRFCDSVGVSEGVSGAFVAAVIESDPELAPERLLFEAPPQWPPYVDRLVAARVRHWATLKKPATHSLRAEEDANALGEALLSAIEDKMALNQGRMPPSLMDLQAQVESLNASGARRARGAEEAELLKRLPAPTAPLQPDD